MSAAGSASPYRIRNLLALTLAAVALPALAGMASLHEALPAPGIWHQMLAGVLLLAAIGRKHFTTHR